jgi:hypothetical protein
MTTTIATLIVYIIFLIVVAVQILVDPWIEKLPEGEWILWYGVKTRKYIIIKKHTT